MYDNVTGHANGKYIGEYPLTSPNKEILTVHAVQISIDRESAADI